ncbi:two-partner secretion domain-containing protein [Nostoc sp. UHCC 0870]|uniref:two-partner secretion domain-containing protein n=1 Tax=Nostoc sp. UHCC 0870 TaxID=2914041 RepID=UPI001EDCDA33|nr:filamentous hemagglutinin N-terminal domain-containing protein [Nostoc sp. UHCC 0870]UKO95918.1 filamentous hemagglutinin N-terminal domain-containing protein [Nostoc sp. UHCC 0870]
MFEATISLSSIVRLNMAIAAVIGAVIWSKNPAIAQINPDTTLLNNSTVTTNGNIINIQGGTPVGSNLFHSFQDFSVPTGNIAYFNNALNIQNIISRVTGQSISNIDGLIRSNGTANLFFINPNGIVFGQNARLDIGGSFFASTANMVKFADGFEFSAVNTSQTPLLTVSVPVGLQMGQNPTSIQVQGNSLEVQRNQTLALVGGNLSLEGATLRTTGGSIELGSVAGIGLVSITPKNQGFSLGYENLQSFGNIDISQQAEINASGIGGDIQVQGKRVTLTDGANIETSTTLSEKGGNLTVTAESINITGTSTNGVPSTLIALSLPDSTEDGGNLTINTRDLLIENGARIFAGTFGAGKGGNLTVNAESINITGTSTNGVPSTLLASSQLGSGNGGNLTINTRDLLIQNGSQVGTTTFGTGKGGNLTVNAESINITGTSTNRAVTFLLAASGRGSTGNGGNLTINTRDLLIQNGAQVITSTFNTGKGGNLTVTADFINLTGSSTRLSASSEGNNMGDAGDITIKTRDLLIQNGAQVNANTFGLGKGGNLTVTADSINITGTSTNGISSGLSALSSSDATGDAGQITINTRNLLIQNGGQVNTSTFGVGKGGDLIVTAESINLSGASSGLFAISGFDTTEDGGNVTINTSDLLVEKDARVATGTFGAGKAGNLSVTADFINITDSRSALSAFSSFDATGNAGDITINTRNLLIQNGGQVFTSTFGAGKAGNLSVTADFINITDSRSALSAFSSFDATGNAGDITINTRNLLIQNGGQVFTSTFGAGKGGDLKVTADFVNLTGASGLFASSELNSTGDAGDITINTRDLLIQNGAQVNTSTSGVGKGGDLKVTAESINLTGASTGLSASSDLNSTGDAGDITINTRDLLIQNGAQVNTSTSGVGKGGNLNLTADFINITGRSTTTNAPSGLFSSSDPDTTGNAGDITIKTRDLLIQNGAQVVTGTFGTGRGGDLTVMAESINVTGSFSGLFASSAPDTTGDAGDIIIDTSNLLIQNGGVVSNSTFGAGKGGNLTVTAESINLTGSSSGLFAASEPNAIGNAADLTIKTRDLLIENGAVVSASTFGAGKGGNLTVTAESINITGRSTNNNFPSGLFTSSSFDAIGNAGSLTINTGDLWIQNGGVVSASTFGVGNGGNLTVTAESINITGSSSGLFAASEPNAIGDAGDLTIKTRDLLIEDRGGVFVNSLGQGNAGNLDINANSIRLDKQGTINADTRGGGGNIFLRSSLIVLRNQSAIATNATGENIPGGNITIDTTDGFIVAVPQENSDISANSAEFRGGNVTINAMGIFGIQSRNVITPESDITATGASPELSGNIQINTSDTTPSRGLINLPSQPVDMKIAQGCQVSVSENQSSFVVTGRGGLPQNPREVFYTDQVQLDWATLSPKGNNRDEPTVTINSTIGQPMKIVEATGWVTNMKNEILLTASSTNLADQNPSEQPAICAVAK